MNTILKYVNAEEIAGLREIQGKGATAKAESVRIQSELGRVHGQISERMRSAPASSVNAARALIGGGTALQLVVAPPGPSLTEMQTLVSGLKHLTAENQALQEYWKAEYHKAFYRMLKLCAERAAEDYVTAAEQLTSLYRMLGSVDGTLRAGDQSNATWPEVNMRKLFIPCYSGLKAMKKYVAPYAQEVMFEGHGVGALLNDDIRALRTETTEVLGSWPL